MGQTASRTDASLGVAAPGQNNYPCIYLASPPRTRTRTWPLWCVPPPPVAQNQRRVESFRPSGPGLQPSWRGAGQVHGWRPRPRSTDITHHPHPSPITHHPPGHSPHLLSGRWSTRAALTRPLLMNPLWFPESQSSSIPICINPNLHQSHLHQSQSSSIPIFISISPSSHAITL
jgi:hypothetical protein